MNIYEFNDYKKFLKSWIATLPKAGRGEFRKIALRLGVSTTMVSQVFSSTKHLSLELASELADYLALNDLETDYFFLLVEYGRAGSHKLQQKLERRIEARRQDAKRLSSRLTKASEVSDASKAVFYSSWIYSAVRMLTALDEHNNADSIAERLKVPRGQIQRVLDFLINEGLVTQKNHRLDLGARQTHINANSPLVTRHHQNWRLQGFQKMLLADSDALFYTGPMAVSREVAEKIREELPAFIEKINKWLLPSPSETVHCLNIDWFEI